MPRRGREVLFEGALEVRLVGKARGQGDVGNQCAIAQLAAGKLDASVDHEGVGRQAVILLERADQVRRRQVGRLADVLEFQGQSAVSADVVGGAFEFVVDLAYRCQRRVQTLLHLGEVTHQRALFLQQFGLFIH